MSYKLLFQLPVTKSIYLLANASKIKNLASKKTFLIGLRIQFDNEFSEIFNS